MGLTLLHSIFSTLPLFDHLAYLKYIKVYIPYIKHFAFLKIYVLLFPNYNVIHCEWQNITKCWLLSTCSLFTACLMSMGHVKRLTVTLGQVKVLLQVNSLQS